MHLQTAGGAFQRGLRVEPKPGQASGPPSVLMSRDKSNVRSTEPWIPNPTFLVPRMLVPPKGSD